MSIIKNGKNIIGVYKGDTPISKIFKHNNLVYQISSTGGTETPYDITSTFNVTSTTSPTQLCYSSSTSAFTEMYVDNMQISPTSAYTFNTTGEHTVGYTLSDKTKIVDSSFQDCQRLSSIVIPDTVISIGDYAFFGCSSLTSIDLGKGIKTIGNAVFYYCSSLTYIVIPSSVTSIGLNAFNTCYFHKDNFINNSSATNYPWSAIIYDTVQDDGLYILGTTAVGCKENATNVIIPSNITSISNSAFYNCTSLTSVDIGNSVTSIGDYAFYNCRSLTSVTIPDNVTSIYSDAFSDCSSLTSVTIGNSVTSIGDNAFSYCSSLNEITCLATTAPTLNGTVFSSLPTNGTLTYPCGSDYSAWLEQLRWKDTCNQGVKWVTLTQDTDRSIQMQTFRIDMTKPEMSSGYYFITFSTEPNYPGDNADITDFSICINEDSIYDNISRKNITEQTPIERNVYEYTFSVPVYFAGGERNAPLSQVKYKTTGATEPEPGPEPEPESPYDITAKFDVITIEPTVLCFSAYTSAFTEMYVDGIQISPTSSYKFSSIGEYTVGYMLKDKTTIAGNLMDGHFKGCSRMKEIKFKDELTSISGPSFSGCTSLQKVTFGSGLTSIGTDSGFLIYSIFTGCTSLTEITCLATTAPTLLKKSIQGIENNNGVLYVPQGSDYSTWKSILTTWTIQFI